MSAGIDAEATLFYHHGEFYGLPSTYPGYLSAPAIEVFSTTRAIYVEPLRRFGDSALNH